MALTILEMAANVRQSKAAVDELCSKIRQKNGDWTGHSLAAEDAMRIGEDGLRSCQTMLNRLHSLAVRELARIEAQP